MVTTSCSSETAIDSLPPSFCPHQPHNSPQSIHVLHAKVGSARPGKCQDKRRAILTDPKIHHKAPQLTTNPEDRFFPQRTGPTNKLDLVPSGKHPRAPSLSPFELE